MPLAASSVPPLHPTRHNPNGGASSPVPSVATLLPTLANQDLKVTLQESTLVCPSQQIERRSIFLSNIDQMHNYYMSTASFFPAHSDFPPGIVAERLIKALEKVVRDPYDFVAGRLTRNQQNGRLEIDCNSAGAGFVVASSKCSLDDLGGDSVFSNPGVGEFALSDLWPEDDCPICIIQVTSFNCGGFAIGLAFNHVLFDGIAAQKFMANLATQAFDDDKPLDSIPCNDRHLLAARSPPLVSFPHSEYWVPENLPAAPNHEVTITKIFKLTSRAITYLKDKARDPTNTKITTYTIAAALIWRCKALSDHVYDRERVSTFHTSIDMRPRLMNPPLPNSYSGNGALFALSSMKCEDLEKQAFREVVKEVADGVKRFTDEYATSVIDLLGNDVGKMKPRIEYNVSCWLRLGFDQVEYPWGKPVSSGPLLHVACVCFLFPSVGDGGINALVTLPLKEMERFQAHFLGFFP